MILEQERGNDGGGNTANLTTNDCEWVKKEIAVGKLRLGK
jgi:hypothetical protein